MFKFKMSLLLKNVKFRVAVAVLAIVAIIAGTVLMPRNKAALPANPVNIKANPSGITAGGANFYVIEKDGVAEGYNNLFCIEEDAELSYTTYQNPIDISNAGGYFTDYNSAMWLINNMYVSNATGTNGLDAVTARNVLALNLANMVTSGTVKNEVAKLGFDGSNVTPQKVFELRNKNIGGQYSKNALEVAEQIALWKYTKNAGTSFSSAYRNNPNQFLNGANLTDDEQRTLKYTYYALTVLADRFSMTTSTKNVSNPVVLNKKDARFDENTHKVGPYYLDVNATRLTSYNFGSASEAKYPVVVEITNADGTTATPGVEVFEKNADGSFYINLSQYPDARKVSFRLQFIMTGINTNAYVVDGGYKQNLMNIEKSIGAGSVGDTKEIVVAIPEGTYSINLKKVKEDGTTVITSSAATFKINGNEQNTTNGILNIATAKKIENTNQVDTYEIVETKAPEGYTAFDGTMKLNVKFKEVDKKFVIDKDNTTTEGFVNGAKIEISQDNASITVTVPNKEIPKEPTPGKYSVELYKVDNTGAIISTPAKFEVNGKEATTENGRIIVASNVEVKDDTTVTNYTIKETGAPENYKLFDGTITLGVKMSKVEDAYVLTQDGITFNVDKQNQGVSYKLEGSTIKIYVPNTHKIFDLSLRKFITKIDGVVVVPSREPVINEQSIIHLQETGTASYYHEKNSLSVKLGSEVEYTIRVYNEGEVLGYAKQITDYLPEGLVFVRIADESNKLYTTTSEAGSRVVVLDYTGNRVLYSLRDFIGKTVFNVSDYYYQEVKIICKVVKTDATYITSRSEITNYGYYETESNGNKVWKEATAIGNVDIDSVQNTIKNELNLNNWYEQAKERTYVDNTGKTVVDRNYFPGAQDDDDFETVELLTGKYNIIIKKVDADNDKTSLSGAYFSVKANNADEREIGPTSDNGEAVVIRGVAIESDKQIDEYTIKETKAPKNYKLYDGEVKVKVATKFDGNNLVIDSEKTTVDGKDVKFSVNKDNTTLTVVVPDVKKEFDLSLRKFITEINGKELAESRVPQVDVSKLASGESTTATYIHPKNTVDVNTTDIVTYTIRVYNEGGIDGFASKIMDDVPQGLEFLPENEVNKEYKWVMYKEAKLNDNKSNAINYNDKTYVVTTNASEADLLVTNYLDNSLIKAFDANTKTLDYKDVKVSFKVVEPKTSNRVLTNYAQITEHKDLDGNVIPNVIDRDSTPNFWIDGEDDQDIESVKVRYFDLALRKWVTKAIVYENGIEKVTETNHTPYDNPEPVVKVDLLNTNINNVTVKFEYSIRIINEGEIPGYAKEISDYIPEGLKFVAEDNKDWKEVDGKIVTRQLENTLLQPGEYADVTVILTWINGANNLGLKTNIAEISEDYNEWGTPDIDSTPNNKVPGEDDIDDAPVILTIRTGAPIVYTGVAVAAIAIVSAGVILIRKKVLA